MAGWLLIKLLEAMGCNESMKIKVFMTIFCTGWGIVGLVYLYQWWTQ